MEAIKKGLETLQESMEAIQERHGHEDEESHADEDEEGPEHEDEEVNHWPGGGGAEAGGTEEEQEVESEDEEEVSGCIQIPSFAGWN